MNNRTFKGLLFLFAALAFLLVFAGSAAAWGGGDEDKCHDISHSMTVYNNSTHVIDVSSRICHSCENKDGCIGGGGGPTGATFGIIAPGESKRFNWVNKYDYKSNTTLDYTASKKSDYTKYKKTSYSASGINGDKTWSITNADLQ